MIFSCRSLTLRDCVSETGEGDLAEDFNFIEHLEIVLLVD